MKKIIALWFVLFAASVFVQAQDCFKFYPSKIGNKLEYTSYDSKNQVTAVSTTTIKDKKLFVDSAVLIVTSEINTKNPDTTIISDYEIACKGSKLYLNFSSAFTQNPEMQNFRIETEGVKLTLPDNLSVGQALEGGNLTIKIYNGDVLMMTTVTTFSNRLVASKENVTTPAGTFSCYKITYDIESSMGFIKSKLSSAEWYSEKYGLIKSENYDKKGKLSTSQVLTKIISF